MKNPFLEAIDEHIGVMECLRGLSDDVGRVASATVQTHRSAGKVVLFGNGGSSCDAQHIAAEMSPEELLRGNVNLK